MKPRGKPPKTLSKGENHTSARLLKLDDVVHYARLARVKGAKSIPGLKFESPTRLPVEPIEDNHGQAECYVIISGTFTGAEGVKLLYERRETIASIDSPGQKVSFTVRMPMDRLVDDLVFDAVDDRGNIQPTRLLLTLVTAKAAPPLANRWSASASLGPTLILHEETAAPSFQAWTLTAKASLDFKLTEKLTLGVFGYVSTLQFLATLDGISPRFIGASARVSYSTDWLSAPWFMSLSLGYYYTTLFGVGDTYGFSNILGPQPVPYPTFGRRFIDGSVLTVTPKFSPILVSINGGWFDHLQTAFGVRYSRPLRDSRSWFLSADYSLFHSTVGPDSISSTSFSLAGGMGI